MSIVWTNGTFDILHPGHMQLFKVARSLGDKVIVATDTDEESRDKGGDWVPALTAVWDAAQALLMEDDLDSEADYRSSMEWLSEVSGSGSLP